MARFQSYSELLLDPRWQRKRLEILNRAEFKCEECGADERTLHVHHTFYLKRKKPWEYPDASLLCLCGDCHVKYGEAQTFLACCAGVLSLEDQRKVMQYARTIGGANELSGWLQEIADEARAEEREMADGAVAR